MELATVIMTSDAARPTFPSIQPKSRYMTTPIIVKILGVYTP
jgi:hypothetical protein